MAYFQGAYTGLRIVPFAMTPAGAAQCDTFLDAMTAGNQQDSVIAVNCFPIEFINQMSLPSDPNDFMADNPDPAELSETFELSVSFVDPVNQTIHEPKNKKLYIYPYKQIEVDCLSGAKTFEPERFILAPPSDSSRIGGARFKAYGCLSPDPEIVVVPQYYDGEVNAVEHAQIVRGFPSFAYVIDSYRAWQALHTTQMQLGTAAGMASGVIGSAVSLNPGGIVSSIASIATYDERNRLEREKGDTIKGAQGSNAMIGTRMKGIYFREKGLLPEYAKIIDDFFTKYGYSSGQVKVPNRSSRPKWNYTKTQNCSLTGDVPASSLEKIRAIYNAGITFWKNASEVGHYELDNAPV